MNEPVAWAEIDLSALRHNLKLIRSALKKSRAQILAVVKADAYGHGMEKIASALWREGIVFFGVANIDEAAKLRRVLAKAKILVLGSFHPRQIPVYFRRKIIPTVSSREDVRHLARFLSKTKKSDFPVHVKIDTGMGRLGIWHEEAGALFGELKKYPAIRVDGVYTHFASAGDRNGSFTFKQLRRFERAAAAIRRLGFRPRYLHAANSLGLVRFRKSHLNLVRPGIMLYGINPSGSPMRGLAARLRPVMGLKARIAFLKKVEEGRTLSYGRTHQTKKKTEIATLPIGYSHGYKLGFSNRAFVFVRGRKCPVVGRVTMDQTLVDVGRVPGVKRWDVVTLMGKDGRAQITADELAAHIQSIAYEIVCSIHSRIPRIYKG